MWLKWVDFDFTNDQSSRKTCSESISDFSCVQYICDHEEKDEIYIEFNVAVNADGCRFTMSVPKLDHLGAAP